jgi:hypothetical protein
MDCKLVVEYAEARRKIRDGDILLFRSKGFLSQLIRVGGRSEYSHAAMAGWWSDRLMCVEMTDSGGQAQLLSNLVERMPGAIDVFRANATRRRFSREKALAAMVAITGKPYGNWNLIRAAAMHAIFFRFLVTPDTDDSANGSVPFCSQAVARACRAGGVDPVPNLADRLTEPGDLARSAFFEYRFTLGSNPSEKKQDNPKPPGIFRRLCKWAAEWPRIGDCDSDGGCGAVESDQKGSVACQAVSPNRR